MKPCCDEGAKGHLRDRRDLAACDRPHALVLGDGVEQDVEDTLAALEESHPAREHACVGDPWVIAEVRRGR